MKSTSQLIPHNTRRAFLGLASSLGASVNLARAAPNPKDQVCPIDDTYYRRLIGIPGSRSAVLTPAALIDLDAVDRNVARMQLALRRQSLALRPHAKAHKCSALAKRQIAAGAIGVCCATLGEAQAMAQAGITGILITTPMPTLDKMARVRELHETAPNLMFTADSLEGLTVAEHTFESARRPAGVVIDVDVGDHRTGMSDLEMVKEALRRLQASQHLRFRGFQGYSGRSQHAPDRNERLGIMSGGLALLRASIDLARADGNNPEIVSGGGTGTFDLLDAVNLYTELQAGSYLVMDDEYNAIWRAEALDPPFETGLLIEVSVISANHPAYVTTDGGAKAFATDAGPPVVIRGAAGAVAYRTWGDEHGKLSLQTEGPRPPIGTRVECCAPHCDPTINLYSWLIGVRGQTIVELFRVDGRTR